MRLISTVSINKMGPKKIIKGLKRFFGHFDHPFNSLLYAFLFYVVIDTMSNKKEMKNFETVINREGKKLQKNGNIIHLQNTGKEYRIIIDLRAFDNNENNVHISTSGNILTIVGRTVRKSKNDEQISEFQQNYLFGSNVKLSDLTKETYGNYYVINIPIKKSEIEEE